MVNRTQKLRVYAFSFLTSSLFRLFRKKHAIKITILFTITLSLVFLYKQTKINISSTDNISLFLENIMIREGGLYTLVGSKPMTLFRVHPEISDFSLKTSFCDSSEVSQKEIEGSRQYLSKLAHLKHDVLWEAWTKENLSLNSKIYLLTTRTSSCSERPMGVFINIPNAVYVLSSNYTLFEKETGISFNPENILEEIGSNISEFWNHVFENHYLLGILLGYGKQNAFIFNWAVKLANDSQDIPIRKKNEDYDRSGSIRYNKKIKVKNLTLPYFYYFNIYSEEIERYKKERDLIINEFEGIHFKSKTLEYLTK